MDANATASTSSPPHTSWGTIAVVYVAGVVTAMSLGKFSPVEPAVADELGLSLTQSGWVISMVVGVGAAVGLPAGYLVHRFGARRSLVAGLTLTALAGATGAAAAGYPWLLTARAVEGVGYLLVTIACPALILRLARERDRATALSVWATFVPLGLGAGTLTGGLIGSTLGWRTWIAALAALTLTMALLTRTLLPRGAARPPAAVRLPRANALLWPAVLASALCLAALVTLPVIVLLPTFLVDRHGYSPATAGATTSVISLLSALGGLAAGALLRRRTPIAILSSAGLLTIPAAWLMFAPAPTPSATLTSAATISIVNGYLGALVLATLPLVLQHLDHADVGNAVVAQAGSLGVLLGPPLFGLITEGPGPRTLIPVTAIVITAAVAALLLVAGRERRHRRGVVPADQARAQEG